MEMLTAKTRVRSRPRRRLDRVMTRLVNPVVRWVLRSPVHDLLSGSVVLVTVTGRSTGREITVPADYLERDGELTLASSRRRQWWRNLLGDGRVRVRVRVRGVDFTGRASVCDDPEKVIEALSGGAWARGRSGLTPAQMDRARDSVTMTIRLDEQISAHPAGGLWRRWFVATVLGEIAGFSVPAVVAAAVVDSPWITPVLQAVLVVAAGVAEGALLGLGQAYALRTAVPDVPTRSWVGATAAGAAVAWAIGGVPVALGDRVASVPVPLWAAAGVVMLLSMGVFQWWVLRRHVSRAWQWMVATTGGWSMALAVFGLITTPLWQPGQSAVLIALIGLLGAVAMAATVATVTGTTLVRLVRH